MYIVFSLKMFFFIEIFILLCIHSFCLNMIFHIFGAIFIVIVYQLPTKIGFKFKK